MVFCGLLCASAQVLDFFSTFVVPVRLCVSISLEAYGGFQHRVECNVRFSHVLALLGAPGGRASR